MGRERKVRRQKLYFITFSGVIFNLPEHKYIKMFVVVETISWTYFNVLLPRHKSNLTN